MVPTHRFRPAWIFAFTLALCLAGTAALQAQTTNASVAGTVKDDQGGVLPGATVTLVSNTQGTETSVVSDSLGNFLFPYVK
ncbi:MAG: carboxypeptidase regulatory-like domain-containing protein, partial [Acidobacteria bacterium]|nr:carboxypeptidase regulatory-like domain-containing protein [Acidobacteriota bacterium]